MKHILQISQHISTDGRTSQRLWLEGHHNTQSAHGETTNTDYLRHTADVHGVGLLPRQIDGSRQVLQQDDPDHVVPREPVEVVDAELERAVLELRVADVEREGLVELRVERLAVYLGEERRGNQKEARQRVVVKERGFVFSVL